MSNPIHRRSVDRFMAMADGREEVSVLASEYDALESENEALRSQLTDALNRQTCENGQPYVCHALATARSRLADIESQNRVMWDVANDREARLAEAERDAARYRWLRDRWLLAGDVQFPDVPDHDSLSARHVDDAFDAAMAADSATHRENERG